MIQQLRITRLEKLQKVRQRSSQNDTAKKKKKMYKHERPRKYF